MLSNRINYSFPNFRNLIFFFDNFFISHIIFCNIYNFFHIINSCFSYSFFKNSKKYNTFFLKSFNPHWVRVIFRGKGYRLRKFNKFNKLTLNFGHSHWAKLLLTKNYFFKKLKRQNYLSFVEGYSRLVNFQFSIRYIKRLNRYTKRGLRLRKQYIGKRFGKISQVVSSLH